MSFDAVLEVCQNQRRRIVLGILAEEQRSLTLDDLTKAIIKHDHQNPSTEASEDVLAEVYLSLCHVHLPKLSSKGLINYDPERQLVEPIEQLDPVPQTLSTILDADPTLKAPLKP